MYILKTKLHSHMEERSLLFGEDCIAFNRLKHLLHKEGSVTQGLRIRKAHGVHAVTAMLRERQTA